MQIAHPDGQTVYFVRVQVEAGQMDELRDALRKLVDAATGKFGWGKEREVPAISGSRSFASRLRREVAGNSPVHAGGKDLEMAQRGDRVG